jgi:hypothetical protein
VNKSIIDAIFPGTSAAIEAGLCPTCGKPVDKDSFRDQLSLREYGISGMCQDCQDSVFGDDDE